MLSDSWLTRILQRVELAYPGRFPPKAAAPELIRAEWARELEGMTAEQIKHALANLPTDYPPNALTFKALCNSAPKPATPLPVLPKGKPSPETVDRVQAFTEALAQGQAQRASADPKGWAKKLRAREQAGETLRPVLAQAWREALASVIRSEAIETESGGTENGIAS